MSNQNSGRPCAGGSDDSFVSMVSGVIVIDHDCPHKLRQLVQDDGMVAFDDFFRRPSFYAENAKERRAVRTLLHEHCHWYQLVSNGFIANMYAAEHERWRAYEKTGKHTTPSSEWSKFHADHETYKFSSFDLMEAQARFWDIHQINPKVLIQDLVEEGEFPVESLSQEIQSDLYVANKPYDQRHFDWLLKFYSTKDNDAYAKTLASIGEHLGENVHDHSLKFQVLFPILSHWALCTRNPVENFMREFLHFGKDGQDKVAITTGSHGRHSVNELWVFWWKFIWHDAERRNRARGETYYTSGMDVLSRRDSCTINPCWFLFPNQHKRLEELYRQTPLPFLPPKELQTEKDAELIGRFCRFFALDIYPGPEIVFGLMGQPNYRAFLGSAIASPVIQFNDFDITPIRNANHQKLAKKIEAVGPMTEAEATAMFATSVTPEQAAHLGKLFARFGGKPVKDIINGLDLDLAEKVQQEHENRLDFEESYDRHVKANDAQPRQFEGVARLSSSGPARLFPFYDPLRSSRIEASPSLKHLVLSNVPEQWHSYLPEDWVRNP